MSSDLEKKFKRCVEFLQNQPKEGASYSASNEEKLKLYGLFKQATEGVCKGKRPSALNFVAKSKW